MSKKPDLNKERLKALNELIKTTKAVAHPDVKKQQLNNLKQLKSFYKKK